MKDLVGVKACWRRAYLTKTLFTGSSHIQVGFFEAVLNCAIFPGGLDLGAIFDCADLSNIVAASGDFSGCSFVSTNLRAGDFLAAIFDGSHMKTCYGARANFHGACLLDGVNVTKASFVAADMPGLQAADARIDGANYCVAYLSDFRVVLEETDLSDSVLDAAILPEVERQLVRLQQKLRQRGQLWSDGGMAGRHKLVERWRGASSSRATPGLGSG